MANNVVLSIVIKAINEASAQLQTVTDGMKDMKAAAMDMAVASALNAAAGAAMLAPAVAAVGAYSEYGGALAHVQTAMHDGAETQAHLNELQRETIALSNRSVITAKDEADAYYIARSNMLDHAQALAAIRAATELSIGTTHDAIEAQRVHAEVTRTMTTLFLNFGDKSRDPIMQMQHFSDLLAKVQTQKAFANISEVTHAMEYAAPAAQAARISAEQTLAALAALSASGKHGAEAGTAFRELTQAIASGGPILSFVKYAKDGSVDLYQTMLRVQRAYGSLSVGIQGRALEGLGLSSGAAEGVMAMFKHMNEFGQTLKDVNNVSGAAAEAARARQAALDEQWVIAKNNLHNIFIEIGGQLAPTVLKLVTQFRDLLGWFQRFTEGHREVVKTIGALAGVGAALIGLAAIQGTVTLGLTVLTAAGSAAILPFRAAIGIFQGVTMVVRGFQTAWMLLNAAFAASPIGVTIAAVAALGFGAYEVWKHWDTIRSYFGKWAQDVAEFIVHPFKTMKAAIEGAIPGVKSAALSTAGAIAKFFVGHSPIPEGPLRSLNMPREIARTMKPAMIAGALRPAAGAVALAATLMAPGAAYARGGPITIHMPVTINVRGGNAAEIGDAVKNALAQHRMELLNEIERARAERDRRNY